MKKAKTQTNKVERPIGPPPWINVVTIKETIAIISKIISNIEKSNSLDKKQGILFIIIYITYMTYTSIR